jgi:hypothetical protein
MYNKKILFIFCLCATISSCLDIFEQDIEKTQNKKDTKNPQNQVDNSDKLSYYDSFIFNFTNVSKAVFSHNSKMLAFFGDNNLFVLDLASKNIIKKKVFAEGYIKFNGKLVFSSDDQSIFYSFLNRENNKLFIRKIAVFGNTEEDFLTKEIIGASYPFFSYSGKYLVYKTKPNTWELFNLHSQRLEKTYNFTELSNIAELIVDYNDKYLVALDMKKAENNTYEPYINILNINKNSYVTVAKKLESLTVSHGTLADIGKFSIATNSLLFWRNNLFDLNTASMTKMRSEEPSEQLRNLRERRGTISPDGRFILSGPLYFSSPRSTWLEFNFINDNRKVKNYFSMPEDHISKIKNTGKFKILNTGEIYYISVSPDSKYVVVNFATSLVVLKLSGN